LDSIEQAFFGHRAGRPDCIKVSDDFAGLDVARLRVIDLIAFLTVTIESKSVFDVPNLFSIFIKMTRRPLPPMLPRVSCRADMV
jgi:hypothetical protein